MPPISGSVSTSVASRSGDASSGLSQPFQYNAAFNVSGSGAAGQTQDASNGIPNTASNLLTYVALGIAGFAALLAIVAARR